MQGSLARLKQLSHNLLNCLNIEPLGSSPVKNRLAWGTSSMMCVGATTFVCRFAEVPKPATMCDLHPPLNPRGNDRCPHIRYRGFSEHDNASWPHFLARPPPSVEMGWEWLSSNRNTPRSCLCYDGNLLLGSCLGPKLSCRQSSTGGQSTRLEGQVF